MSISINRESPIKLGNTLKPVTPPVEIKFVFDAEPPKGLVKLLKKMMTFCRFTVVQETATD